MSDRITEARALVVELREIHERSRQNAIEQGWGIPPKEVDHSPWSRAADMIVALIDPPTDDERHAGYVQLHDLVREAPEGVRRAVGNDKQRVLANGSFALHPSMLLRLLTRAYDQGVRSQGPVTDAEVEAMRSALNVADIDYSARAYRADAGGGEMEPGDWFTFLARAALEVARATR